MESVPHPHPAPPALPVSVLPAPFPVWFTQFPLESLPTFHQAVSLPSSVLPKHSVCKSIAGVPLLNNHWALFLNQEIKH